SITHVDPMQLALSGQTTWRKTVEQIPGMVQAGNGFGKSTYGTMPDSPLAPVLISINGGLPYETATLLDDMPLIGTTSQAFFGGGAGSGTDLSVYPLNGFSGADVVRGPGAGAPSIVDSIGGSFVLHMAGPVSSNHYSYSVADDPYGGWSANAQASVRFGKLSV